MANANDQLYEFDPRSILAALSQVNKAFQSTQKGAVDAGEQWNTAFSNLSDQIVKYSDRSVQAQNRLAKSTIAANEAWGKSAIDQTLAKRDRVIAQLGANKKAVDAVTKSYDDLIKRMKEADTGGHGNGPLSGAGRFAFLGAKDLFEGRATNAIAEGANVLTKLGGTALLIGGVAGALGGLTLAATHARKELADYAVTIKDIEEETGLSAKQTQQFSFAAQAVGKDISIVTRLQRGLSQAVEDFGPTGDKARGVLREMGVSLTDLRGESRPVGDLLLDISGAMNKLAPGTKLSADAIDLFKRAGVDAIPFLKELKDNVEYAEKHGLPTATEEEIQRWSKYNQQIAAFDTFWQAIKRAAANTIAVKIDFVTSVTGPLADWLSKKLGGDPNQQVFSQNGSEPGKWMSFDEARKEEAQKRERQQIEAVGGESALKAAASKAQTFLDTLGGTSAEQAQTKLTKLKTTLDEQVKSMQSAIESGRILPAAADEHRQKVMAANSAYEKQKAIVAAISKSESERTSNLEALRKLIEETQQAVANTGYISPVDKKLDEFSRRAGVTAAQINDAERALRGEAQLFANSALSKSGFEQTSFTGIIGSALDRVHPLNNTNESLEGAISSIGSGGKVIPKSAEQLSEQIRQHRLDQEKEFTGELARQKEVLGQRGEAYTNQLNEANKLTETQLQMQYKLSAILAPDDTTRRGLEQSAAQAQIAQLDEVYREQQESIRTLYDDQTRRDTALNALKIQHAREVGEVEGQIAEKNAETVRGQLDSIKKSADELLTTLFNNPSKFGSQFLSTIKSAVLRPITSGISEGIAQTLYRPIFGAQGNGGIAGSLRNAFGGNPGAPLMPAASALTGAAGALYGAASAISVANGGSAISAPSGLGGGFGFGGGGLNALGTSSGGGLGLAGMLGPGGTSGFSGPISLGGGGGSGGGFGGGGGLGGLINIFKGWKGDGVNIGDTAANGDTIAGAGWSTGAKSAAGLGAGLAIAGGTSLFSAGAFGNHRGTWGGIGMTTLGGALTGGGIGFMLGGPIGGLIGAGIGAIAGFGVGLGEKLAGVESPRVEAKRLVKAQYGIDINNGQADAIAQIAKERYGNTVSIAVRSPEVRQMLGIYAAGTGQAGSFAQSALTPHGGGLVESGGTLYQNPQYQYGNRYAYSTAMPVYGGGGSYGLPNPGGGAGPALALSINVDGKGIAPFFKGDVVTPDYVQSQQQAAWRGSNGRVDSSLALQQPGAIAS